MMKSYNASIKFPFRILEVGGSGSGKTVWCCNFLQTRHIVTDNENCENVIFYYNQPQELLNNLPAGVITKQVQGFPSLEQITQDTFKYRDRGGSIVIIDDFAHLYNKDILELVTVYSHHGNCGVLLLTQNLFDSRNPIFRQISMNCTHLVLFKNPRDRQQIVTFARQVYPTNSKFIVDSFHKATTYPYSYMLFDNHQETPDEIRYRAKILPHEAPMVVYQPKT